MAGLIDGLVGLAVLSILGAILAVVATSITDVPRTQGLIVGIGLAIGGVGWIAWLARGTARTGQTFGKRIADIRVVSESGTGVDGVQAAIRSILAPVDICVFLIGLWMIIFKRRKQRLGDLAARTLVVRE